MIQAARAMYNRAARWWLARRLLPRIARTRPVQVAPAGVGEPCEVFVLTHDQDRLMALWAVKSFYHHAGVRWPLTWVQGGSLSADTERDLLAHFPGSRVARQPDADRAVESALAVAGLGRLAAARRAAVMFRKLVDPLVLAASPAVMTLDADVLFFARPAELLAAATAADGPSAFFRDCLSVYSVRPEELPPGLRLIPRLNAGVGIIRRSRCPLARVDELVATPGLMSVPWVAEQTVHALLAAEYGAEILPDTYVVSQTRGLVTPNGQAVIAKHYPAHPRYWYLREGLRRLEADGFLAGLASKGGS